MLSSLTGLLGEQIKDMYSAETQLLKALAKMAKKADNAELRAALTAHLEETRGHVDRLEQVAEGMGIKPSGKACKAMKGLLEEASEAMEQEGDAGLVDAGLIAAAQRVEHYEIAAYGSALTLAQRLNLTKAVGLLRATREEEEASAAKLGSVLETEILPRLGGEPRNGKPAVVTASQRSTRRATGAAGR